LIAGTAGAPGPRAEPRRRPARLAPGADRAQFRSNFADSDR